MSTTTILPADLRLGYVHLTIPNLDRSLAFYQNVLGFQVQRRDSDTVYLGAGSDDLLALTERPTATRARRATGLYHFAVLVPSRRELAQVIRRVAQTRTPAQGASDHLVSEAFYLADPDGNGIEIYRDRPRADWPQLRGSVRMDTLPMDLDGVMGELDGLPGEWAGLDAATVLGHMHLHVRQIPEALKFYREVLGFDLMMNMDTALFMSAGGYHHHLGLNTWGTLNAPPAPADSIGLRYFTVQLPEQSDVDAVVARARSVGAAIEDHAAGVLVRDPSHNALVFTVAPKIAVPSTTAAVSAN